MPDRYEPPTAATLAWAGRAVHPRARVTGVERLVGGITADMDRLSVESPTGPRDVVLRRWPQDEWAAGLVARETEALTAVAGHGVPAPLLLAADADGSADADGAGPGVPCTLTSALPGEPDLAPADQSSWIEQLASAQAAIHAVPTTSLIRWEGWYAERYRPLTWLSDPGLREAAREAASGPIEDERVLVHGDYQHFNILWRAGRLTGVVDWPNAASGNRGSDSGHCRLNLAVLLGAEAAAAYLVAYERAAGVRTDRVADLRALLCWDLEWLDFIPVQVAGRAYLDVAGMPDRVAAAVRHAVDGLG